MFLFDARRLVDALGKRGVTPASPPNPPLDDFPAVPGYDFVVGRLGVGFLAVCLSIENGATVMM